MEVFAERERGVKESIFVGLERKLKQGVNIRIGNVIQ